MEGEELYLSHSHTKQENIIINKVLLTTRAYKTTNHSIGWRTREQRVLGYHIRRSRHLQAKEQTATTPSQAKPQRTEPNMAMAPSSPRPSSSRPSSSQSSSSSSQSSEAAGSSTKKRQLVDNDKHHIIGGQVLDDERDSCNGNGNGNNATRPQSYAWQEQQQQPQFIAGEQPQAGAALATALARSTSTIASTSTAASNTSRNAAHSSSPHSPSACYRMHFSCQHVGKYRRATKRRLEW